MIINGMQLYTDKNMGAWLQFRFPRSRRRRIRNKWAKRRRNYRFIPSDQFLIFNGTVICHPVMLDRLRRTVTAND